MTLDIIRPHRAVACATIGFLLRYFITSNFKDTLRQRVEIVTPISDWRRAYEGIHKWNSDIDPYSGNLFHEYPISLQFYKIISNYFNVDVIFMLTDVVTALVLSRSILNQMKSTDAIIDQKAISSSSKALLIYLFSPINLVSCCGQSTAIFTNFLIALITFLLPVRPFRALVCVLCALLACNNMHLVTLILPMFLCMEFYNFKSRRVNAQKDNKDDQATTTTYYTHQDFVTSLWTSSIICLVSIVTLLVTSYLLMGYSWSFLKSTYLYVFHVQDLTPNIGLFWYFFTELFDQFLLFFTWVIQINAFIHVIPISIRFKDEPFFALYMTTLASIIFQPYPSLANIGLITSMTPQFSHLFGHMRHGLKVTCTAITAICLWPIFWHLWIILKTANANFYFGSTMAFSVALVWFMFDLLDAKVRERLKTKFDALKTRGE